MMKRTSLIQKFYFFVFSILILFISCRNNKIKTELDSYPKYINLDLSKVVSDSLNLSEIANRIEYVPLEKTENAILGNVKDVRFSGEYIFIFSEQNVYRFSKRGKFINKIYEVGRGPEEVVPLCFTLNEKDSIVYIYNRNNTVKTFDFNGNYISSILKLINPSESLPPWKIDYFSNTLLVSNQQRPDVQYIYSCYDITKDTLHILYTNHREYTIDQLNKRPIILPYDYNYQVTDSTIMYKEKFSDTIFSVNKLFSITPKYVINLGNNKLKWENWRDQGMFDLSRGLPKGYWIQSFAEFEDFIFITLVSFKGSQIFVIYDKESSLYRLLTTRKYERTYTQVYLKNDLDNIVPFAPMDKDGYLHYYKDCLYSVIDSKEFISYYSRTPKRVKIASKYLRGMAPILSEIDEFDNPIIIKIYLE